VLLGAFDSVAKWIMSYQELDALWGRGVVAGFVVCGSCSFSVTLCVLDVCVCVCVVGAVSV
jgi:uncharacterized membrane protein YesL